MIPPGSRSPERLVIVPATVALNAPENNCTEVRDSLARKESSSFAHCKIRFNKCGHAIPALTPIVNNAKQIMKIYSGVETSVGISHKRVHTPNRLNMGE